LLVSLATAAAASVRRIIVGTINDDELSCICSPDT
jgi:hypothetical protein